MELVSTIEINGEEREIADAYARGQIDAINSNLDGLGYGENAGGKNLIDISKITDNSYVQSSDGMFLTYSNVCRTDYIEVKEGQSVYFSGMKKPNIGNTGAMYDENKNYVGAINNYSDVQPLVIPQGVKYIVLSIWKSLFDDFTKAQLEEGIYKTEYKPYIPSVKMLAEETYSINDSLNDVEFLGWSVPSEMPIKNYVDSDGVLHQRVGRVDLGSLSFAKESTSNGLNTYRFFIPDAFIPTDRSKAPNIYVKGYTAISYNASWTDKKITYDASGRFVIVDNSYTDAATFKTAMKGHYLYYELAEEKTIAVSSEAIAVLKNDLSKQCKKDDITTNETLIGTFNGKNYYRKLFTGISGSGGSITVNVGEKIEIYNYYGRAYTYGQSGASDVKYPIPNKNYYIDSQNASETSFQLTIPTSSDTRKVDLVIEYTKVDE